MYYCLKAETWRNAPELAIRGIKEQAVPPPPPPWDISHPLFQANGWQIGQYQHQDPYGTASMLVHKLLTRRRLALVSYIQVIIQDQ